MPEGAFANASDRRAWEMCRAALRRLKESPEPVRAKALANIAVWERNRTCHPWYARRWREVLDWPADRLEAHLLALTDEAQALRASNPFAGVVRLRRPSTLKAEPKPVRREQLEHILRASAAITGEREFVVVGGPFVEGPKVTDGTGVSAANSVRLFPYRRPDLAPLILEALGPNSPFHAHFGYCALGNPSVSEQYAVPKDSCRPDPPVGGETEVVWLVRSLEGPDIQRLSVRQP